MTKIIQSGPFHGFHLLLIALPALRGHPPHCRAGQGRCGLHLHNGPNSRRDYQQRHLYILYTAKAITLGRAPEPCSMSNAVIAQRSSHLAPLAVCYLVLQHASVFAVSCQTLTELQYISILSISPLYCKFLGPKELTGFHPLRRDLHTQLMKNYYFKGLFLFSCVTQFFETRVFLVRPSVWTLFNCVKW